MSNTSWSTRSLLITVSDLDRSSDFYRDVCDLQEIMREPELLLLGVEASESPKLILRETRRKAAFRGGQQMLGIRACSFCVGTNDELDRVEQRLKDWSGLRDRLQLGENGRVGMVRGHDPDWLPLAFMNYDPPVTGAEQAELLSLVYAWDV